MKEGKERKVVEEEKEELIRSRNKKRKDKISKRKEERKNERPKEV